MTISQGGVRFMLIGDPSCKAPLTPKMARELGRALEMLQDQYYQALDDLRAGSKNTWFHADLPPAGIKYLNKHPYLGKRLVSLLNTMAFKIFSVEPFALACTAEELMLKWLVQYVEAINQDDQSSDWTEDDQAALEDWREYVAEDFDVDLLYSDKKEFVAQLGPVEKWFEPFDAEKSVNPLTRLTDKPFWGAHMQAALVTAKASREGELCGACDHVQKFHRPSEKSSNPVKAVLYGRCTVSGCRCVEFTI